MVIAQFKQDFYNRNIFGLIVYNAGFILAKYIYTLVMSESGDSPYDLIIGISSKKSAYNPESMQEYFRYTPPFTSWVLLFCFALQYTRNKTLTLDSDIIAVKSKRAEDTIAMSSPTLYKIYKIYTIFENHVIVVVTFFAYLMLLFAIRRSFLNTISLLFVLILLGNYMNNGLKSLLKWWNIIAIYQACVLLMLLSV